MGIIIIFVFMAVALTVLAAIGLAIYGLTKKKTTPGLGLELFTDEGGVQRVAGGKWNALVYDDGLVGTMGGTATATPGMLVLQGDVLTFTPEDGQGGWSARAGELAVGVGIARPLKLVGPMGVVHCTASVEKINIYTANDLKTMREIRYARELQRVLVSMGARQA